MFTQPVPQSHEYITRPVTINPVPGRTIAQTELIIEISPKFDLFTLILILVIYYTSHDSSAVVWCAILWPDCISTFLVTSALFRRSRIWAHKLFAKWSSADNTIKTTVDIQWAFNQMAACFHHKSLHIKYSNHRGQVTHVCVNKQGYHWIRYWFVACSVPSHYLNQCWLIINWTIWTQFAYILIDI